MIPDSVEFEPKKISDLNKPELWTYAKHADSIADNIMSLIEPLETRKLIVNDLDNAYHRIIDFRNELLNELKTR